MHQSFFRPNYIFNNNAHPSDSRALKSPSTLPNVNPFQHQQALHFGVLSYEKQHKEGTCKASGRSVAFSALYADFLSLPQISDYHHLKVIAANSCIRHSCVKQMYYTSKLIHHIFQCFKKTSYLLFLIAFNFSISKNCFTVLFHAFKFKFLLLILHL